MSNFNNLKYNVQSIPHNESILKAFATLATLTAFISYRNKDPDKLFRYTILLYDKKSPLVRDIPRLVDRKCKAAMLAGYIRQENGEWAKFVTDIMEWKNESANKVFLAYLQHLNEMKWAQRVSMEENFWENVEILNKRDDSKIDKNKIKGFNNQLLEDIDRLDRELFMEDDNAKKAFNRIRGTSPEKVAERKLKAEVEDV